MRIHATDTLFGLPALELRHLLRRVDSWDGFDLEHVREVHPMSRKAAHQLIASLHDAGYIERTESRRPKEVLWHLTIQGRAFSIAKASKPIKRATADRLVRELLDRIDAVNADEGLESRVVESVVFGSYLGSEPLLNDVDVGIRLESRLPPDADPVAHRKARVALAEANGRIFRWWGEELLWPDKEIWLRLKSRSRGLSLHDMRNDHIFERPEVERRAIYANGRRVESGVLTDSRAGN